MEKGFSISNSWFKSITVLSTKNKKSFIMKSQFEIIISRCLSQIFCERIHQYIFRCCPIRNHVCWVHIWVHVCWVCWLALLSAIEVVTIKFPADWSKASKDFFQVKGHWIPVLFYYSFFPKNVSFEVNKTVRVPMGDPWWVSQKVWYLKSSIIFRNISIA